MDKLTSSSTSFSKLKTVFLLGLTCNLTTLIGCTAAWIVLQKNGWADGFVSTFLLVISFVPLFMGDAINHYTLGRIRLEHLHNWNDVQITPDGRRKVADYYKVLRFFSIQPAYLLAATMLASFSGDANLIQALRVAFFVAFCLNFLKYTSFYRSFFAPLNQGYGGKGLLIRSLVVATIYASWFIWFFARVNTPLSKLTILGSGLLYFFINALMNPLPARYSIIRSGRPKSKEAFFKVEILTEEQLASLPGASEIGDAAGAIQKEGFKRLDNIRMPLIELPLFNAWGSGFVNEEKNILALCLNNEVKKAINLTLVSFSNKNFILSTNFSSPQPKLPAEIDYVAVACSTSFQELKKLHQNRIKNQETLEILQSVWSDLEIMVKTIVAHLEKKTTMAETSSFLSEAVNLKEQVINGNKNDK